MRKQEEGSGGGAAAAAAAAAVLPSSDEDLHGTSFSENAIQHLSLSVFPGGKKLRTISTETTMRKSKTSRARREKTNSTTTTTGSKKSGFKELPQFWNQGRVRV